MFSKRTLAFTFLCSFLLVGCAKLDSDNSSNPPVPVVVEKNLLSGREGSNGPVLVVKIDDTKNSRPQIGLEDADIVYIEQVEGGLTRLAAVFSSIIPERVGPVRSARISDLDILPQFGRVAFAYSGAQKKLLPVIASANLQDLGAQRQSPTIYTRDLNRPSPYNMVLRADLLMQKVADQNYQVDSAKNIGFKFGEINPGGLATSKVVMHWPAATYSAEWSTLESRWLLSRNKVSDVAESGYVLGPTTMVVQLVSISPSAYGDKFGGNTPFSQTVGSGKAYVLRNGQRFEVQWNRPTIDSGTTFTLPDGTVMNFDPGQIWIALTDHEPDFTSPPVPKTT